MGTEFQCQGVNLVCFIDQFVCVCVCACVCVCVRARVFFVVVGGRGDINWTASLVYFTSICTLVP